LFDLGDYASTIMVSRTSNVAASVPDSLPQKSWFNRPLPQSKKSPPNFNGAFFGALLGYIPGAFGDYTSLKLHPFT
jgi:hypothetical protein